MVHPEDSVTEQPPFTFHGPLNATNHTVSIGGMCA